MAAQKRVLEAVEEYIAYRRGRVAVTTWKNEAFVLRRFGLAIGDLQLRHVGPDRVSDWFYGPSGLMSEHRTRDGQQRGPVNAATHNYYRTRIVGLCRWLSLRGHVRVDLMADVPARTVPVRRRQQPGPEILLGLLDHADNPRDRAYLAVAINTGCRAGEITRLRVGDVDLKEGWLLLTIQKTYEQDQQPITSDLDVELRQWLAAYGRTLGRPLTRDDYLFPASTGSRYTWVEDARGDKHRQRVPGRWRPDKHVMKTERIVQEALRRSGLPTKHEGTHTVRRAVARAFFDSMSGDVGYDNALRTVSAMLHHKNSSTTEQYLQLTSERRRRDELLRGRPFLSALVTTDDRVVPLRRTGSVTEA